MNVITAYATSMIKAKLYSSFMQIMASGKEDSL
jgi:hypothetical protein